MSRAKQSYVQGVGSPAPLSWKHQTAAVIPGAQSYITAAALCSMKMLGLRREGIGSGGMQVAVLSGWKRDTFFIATFSTHENEFLFIGMTCKYTEIKKAFGANVVWPV